MSWGFFSQKVIDPIDLHFVEDLMHDAVEFGERLHRCPEGLFIDHAGILR